MSKIIKLMLGFVMKTEEMKKRIQYLKTEISHEGFWDGYSLKGMREELIKLETELYFYSRNQKIEEKLKKNG